MEIEQAYKLKRAAQLKEWGAQLDLLEAQAENTNADVRVHDALQLDDLRARQRAASSNLQELEAVGSDAWEQTKEAADRIWEDLKAGMAQAHARFK